MNPEPGFEKRDLSYFPALEQGVLRPIHRVHRHILVDTHINYDLTKNMVSTDFNNDLFKKWIAEQREYDIFIVRSWELKHDLLNLFYWLKIKS